MGTDFGYGIFYTLAFLYIIGGITFLVYDVKKNKKWKEEFHFNNGKKCENYTEDYIRYQMKDMHFLRGYLDQKCVDNDHTREDEVMLAIVEKIIEMDK